MGIDYNKQRKDREDNNGASGESIVDYWGSSPALCHKFFGKKGGVVFKPCIAECFWSDLYVFHKLGDRDSGIYGSSGNQCSYGSDSRYFGLSGNPGIIRPGSLSYALTDENAVKSRSCGILEGRMRKVTVKMCQRLFFYGKTLVRRKNNGYNPSYNQSRWLYQISYKI